MYNLSPRRQWTTSPRQWMTSYRQWTTSPRQWMTSSRQWTTSPRQSWSVSGFARHQSVENQLSKQKLLRGLSFLSTSLGLFILSFSMQCCYLLAPLEGTCPPWGAFWSRCPLNDLPNSFRSPFKAFHPSIHQELKTKYSFHSFVPKYIVTKIFCWGPEKVSS